MIDFSKLPPECDVLCQWRKCLHKGEDKGHFLQGRGYTSYHREPEYCCMTRLLHGCPIVDGHRPMPDIQAMLESLENEMNGIKMTGKAKRYIKKIHNIIRMMAGQRQR